MSEDPQQQRLHLYQQYTTAYGALASVGRYSTGDTVTFAGGKKHGEVIWKYEGKQGLMYVIDDNSGFPVEVVAREIP